MRGVPPFLSFNGGEVTDLFDGRTDQDRYVSSCAILENMFCTVQGPSIRRAGSAFIATTKNNGVAWLGKFVFNRTQSYILEYGNNYIRFFTNRGQLFDGLNPFEVVSPWPIADLTSPEGTFTLQFAQDGDRLFIFHSGGTYRPRVLSRLGAINWTITDFIFQDGPFQDVDPDNVITITPSALTGSVTLQASSAIFTADQVGSQIYLEISDNISYTAWEVGIAGKNIGDKVTYQGNYYAAASTGTTGTVPPTHTRGTRSDGKVSWTYLHSGYAYGTITVFTDADTVTAIFPGTIPGSAATVEAPVALTRWAFQDVSDEVGWPTCVDFFKERLSCARGRTAYMSSTGSPNDFASKSGPTISAINAIRLSVRQREVEQIRWLAGVRDLICGTPGFEFTIGPQTRDQVFSSQNITSEIQTKYGSITLQPIIIDNYVLMAQAGGLRIREIGYSFEIDRYKAEDISILAEHIADKGIRDICVQNEKEPIIWFTTANFTTRRFDENIFDSGLAGCTYNKARNVVGYHRHIVGGFSNVAQNQPTKVLSCESISSPIGDRDDPWIISERFIDGGIVRYVEYIEDSKRVQSDITDGFFVDSHVTYEGVSTDTITGLEHLEGQIVDINAQGGAHGQRTVVGGQITLDFPVTKAHIGLGYRSRLVTMRPEFGAQDGTAQSRMKSTTEICIRFLNTVGAKFGTRNDLRDIPFRDLNIPVGVPTPLFSGDKYDHMPAEWERDGNIVVVQDQPLPMTVTAIYPRLYTND